MLDLQINGYAGVDFNADDLTEGELLRACQQLSAEGTVGMLATIITADLEAMCRRVRKLAELRERNPDIARVMWGIHIEGPFFPEVPGFIGAHPPEHARPADLDAARRLVDAGAGATRMFTLAPERDETGQVTQWLTDQGVVVAAGHCDPTLDQLERAIDHGLRVFTHLGNGCPLMMHRHDNIIQRALSLSERLTLCFIADGAHIPLFALKNYIKCAGIENSLIVSDDISAAGQGPGTYFIGDQQVTIGEDLVPWSEDRSHLVGSACPLHVMRSHLTSQGFSAEDMETLFLKNPQRLLENQLAQDPA